MYTYDPILLTPSIDVDSSSKALSRHITYPLIVLQTFYMNRAHIALISFFLTGFSLTPLYAEYAENETSEQKAQLSKYWFEADQIGEQNPYRAQLSPQCSGTFVPPQTSKDSADITNEEDGTDGNKNQQTISADKVLYEADGTASFEGNVLVENGEQSISSDFLRYHQETNALEIRGDVLIEQDGLLITSNQAQYDNTTKSSVLSRAEFLMFENQLNGFADNISISQSNTEVNKSQISSCPPDDESWQLRSKELHLDQEKGWGYAKHASLRIAKVPVLYAPYFTFPLNDDRKTGFLYPSLGSDSVNGTDIGLPFYINIAPNYDATLTPRILSKRGEQIAGEFRYLNTLGTGYISGDYLGNDKINETFSERKQAQWRHQKQFSESWSFNSDYFYVSDSDYFDDLNSFSRTTSLGYLERKAIVSYLKADTYFSVLTQDFQVLDTIDDVDQPYRLMPRVSAGYSHDISIATLSLDTQTSRFERDLNPDDIGATAVAEGELSTGIRAVQEPKLLLDFSSDAYFLRPSARLHLRQYRLEDYQTIDQEKSLNYAIPTYSLDSGLIFERPLKLNQTAYTQTLEPRIKLIKTPYKEQSEAPNFDSSLLSFNSAQVFRDRRYAGHDLLGDTEQLSLGLSSKLYDSRQNQKAVFSLGQIVYLEDRRVQLNNTEDPTAKLSPAVASAQIKLIPNWTFNQSIQWSSEENVLNQYSTGVQYKNSARKIANLEFRYRPAIEGAAQKETRTSFYWPISNRWAALSFWNFDLNQHSTIELASGIEYENCCIVVKALNQKWLRKINSEESYQSANKQSLEIQLKGLGNLNTQVSDYLRAKIPGFE